MKILLIVLLLVIAFFMVPSALSYADFDPGMDGGVPTSTPEFPVNIWDYEIVKRCLRFTNVVRTVMQDEGWLIDPAFVFGVMAQESLGYVDPSKTLGWPLDRVGSRGLMQVAPFPWRVDDPEKLLDPRLNIWWGVKTLVYANELSWGNMEMALAMYNCGQEGEARGCGYGYARRVIYHWSPLFREAFEDGRWESGFYWTEEDQKLIRQWLEFYGYKER